MEERAPATISEFAEYYKMRNFNNFFVRLPGTLYRSRATSPSEIKLFRDLDLEAARLGVDTKAILDEMIRGGKKVSEAIAVMRKLGNTPESLEAPEVRVLADEGEALRQSAHQKMIPLFDALVALGYHPNELVR